MFCRAGNKYMPERKRSRPNFLSRERTVLFLNLDCQTLLRLVWQLSDLGKEKSSLGKGSWALTFSSRAYTCFRPYRTFILSCTTKFHLGVNIFFSLFLKVSFKELLLQYPLSLSWRTNHNLYISINLYSNNNLVKKYIL